MATPGRVAFGPIPRRIVFALLVGATAPAWTFTAPSAAVGPRDRRLTNVRAGISIEAPAGWTFSQHAGYADTVVLLIHPDGSRVTVTAAGTGARTGAALYEQNRAGLVAQGLRPSPLGPGARGSFAVDLSAPGPTDRSQKLRQLYLVREIAGGHQAVVLTLACRANAFAVRAPALDFVATRMALEEPVRPPGAPQSGGGPGGGAGQHGR